MISVKNQALQDLEKALYALYSACKLNEPEGSQLGRELKVYYDTEQHICIIDGKPLVKEGILDQLDGSSVVGAYVVYKDYILLGLRENKVYRETIYCKGIDVLKSLPNISWIHPESKDTLILHFVEKPDMVLSFEELEDLYEEENSKRH